MTTVASANMHTLKKDIDEPFSDNTRKSVLGTAKLTNCILMFRPDTTPARPFMCPTLKPWRYQLVYEWYLQPLKLS